MFVYKGGKYLFTVTNNTYVCEFHFEISDIQVSAGRDIKTKDKAIPSIFTVKKMSTPVRKRKSPKKASFSRVRTKQTSKSYR